jgi:hypothetical protein
LGGSKHSISATCDCVVSGSSVKLDRVPEALFVKVGEEEFPGFAGVCGFVEAGEVSFAGGHDDGGVLVEGLDAAEV